MSEDNELEYNTDYTDPVVLREFTLEFHKSVISFDEELEEKASWEVTQERLAICGVCEHFDKKQIECKECGCNLMVKAATIYDECPIDKWDWDRESWYREYFEPIVKNMPDKYSELFYKSGLITHDAEEEKDADKADTED